MDKVQYYKTAYEECSEMLRRVVDEVERLWALPTCADSDKATDRVNEAMRDANRLLDRIGA